MRRHLPFIFFFVALLITGTAIYDDYGVSWDEAECRIDNGILNTNFIRTGDEKPLLESISKYHGAAYEMFLITLERIAGLHSTHEIFLMRHLVTFFLFALSVFFFYLLCLKAFRSSWYALTACLILVLCPRIFADSFYNSKDLPFLSLLIIDLYLLVLFIEGKKISIGIAAAIVAGLMIDIRIMGVILPSFALLLFAIEFIKNKKIQKSIFISTIIFISVLVITIILFWPVLWLNPLQHFLSAWNELSKYPWEGKVLYNGSIYLAADLPWHYLPVWMAISIPPVYTIFFIVGFFVMVKKIATRSKITTIEIFCLYLSVIPLVSILILHSIVYDGWRHIFFIYPAMVIIAVSGIKRVFEFINERNRKYLVATFAAYFTSVIFTMAELHPFENVYFNFLAYKPDSPVRERYEADYWGLSFKQAYEHILDNDNSSQIFVYLAEGQPGTDNWLFLDDELRSRITITEIKELADYYLTCHRYDRMIKPYSHTHQIMAGDVVVQSVYDLRKIKISLNKIPIMYVSNYDTIPVEFHPGKVVTDSTQNILNKAELILSENEYGGNFNIKAGDELVINPAVKRYVFVELKVKSEKPFRSMVDLQIDSSQTYYWNYKLLNNSHTKTWNRFNYIWELPEIYNSTDILKVHLQNNEKGKFLLDDFSIKFYEADTQYVNRTLKKLPF